MYDLPPVTSANDPTVIRVNQFVDTGTLYAVPGNYLVEFFTWMKHIPSPLAKWKREAEKGFEEYSEFFGGMFRKVENRIVSSPSFTFFRPALTLSCYRKKGTNDRALLGLWFENRSAIA